MALDPITAILNIGNTIIDRVIPDKTAAAQAKAQLLMAEVNGEFSNAHDQLTVDSSEAANQSIFVAGWRPFVGWGCGAAFLYAYIVQPMAQVIAVLSHNRFDPKLFPVLDMSDMMPVLLGMLGLGAMRSFDKVQGTGNGH